MGERFKNQTAHRLAESGSPKTLPRICPANWSDREISELRRVERALQLFDLPLELSFGLSDEGEPWCAICRQGNDGVVAHFARVSGTYVGYWGGLSYRDSDCLHDLLDRFLNRLPSRSHSPKCNMPSRLIERALQRPLKFRQR
jgi:hypothetical protein